MDRWIKAADGLITVLARNPETATEKWGTVAVTVILMVVAFGFVARLMKIANTDPARSFGSVVLGGMIAMVAAIAAQEYLADRFGSRVGPWIPLVCAIVAWLAIVVPLTGLWHRSKYGETLFPWVSAIVMGVIAVFLVSAVHDAFMSGKTDASAIKKRNTEIKDHFFK